MNESIQIMRGMAVCVGVFGFGLIIGGVAAILSAIRIWSEAK